MVLPACLGCGLGVGAALVSRHRQLARVAARPSWAKLEPVCRALKANTDVDLQIVACASALLERYGKVVDVIRKDYNIAAEVWSTYEGANLVSGRRLS